MQAIGLISLKKCDTFKTLHEGDYKDVLNDIKAQVRSNYDDYGSNYKNQIDELTDGKSEEYEIPKY